MEKTKKIKIFVGLFYITAICLFLYFFFSKFSLQELTSYDFIRENRSYFFELKNSNLFLLSIIFLVFSIESNTIYKIFYLLFIYLITIKGEN